MERRREAVAGPIPRRVVRCLRAGRASMGAAGWFRWWFGATEMREKACCVVVSIREASLDWTRERSLGRKVPCFLWGLRVSLYCP